MAAPMIMEFHGLLIRDVADALGDHVQGLAQASRTQRVGKYAFCSRTRRRLKELDSAFNLLCHVTRPRFLEFHREVMDQLSASCASRVSSRTCTATIHFDLDQDELILSEACFCPPVGLLGTTHCTSPTPTSRTLPSEGVILDEETELSDWAPAFSPGCCLGLHPRQVPTTESRFTCSVPNSGNEVLFSESRRGVRRGSV
mmetsp:Transcript_14432/g.30306  ORF Transcript_14432/g.30306 Transcript_14432/m.30306 type:complete len:200 (-) Transcript_14432:459-1058(-)